MIKNGIQDSVAFTGKERDNETGYGYFGARYMDHELMTMWLSVDPMADKYPSISPYAYCAWNPVILIDPEGKENVIYVVNLQGKNARVDVDVALRRPDGGQVSEHFAVCLLRLEPSEVGGMSRNKG